MIKYFVGCEQVHYNQHNQFINMLKDGIESGLSYGYDTLEEVREAKIDLEVAGFTNLMVFKV